MKTVLHSLGHAPRGLAGHPLTAVPAVLVALAFHPAPEPDRDILYTSAADGKAERIWRMAPDGSEPRALTPPGEGLLERFPVWSPDGRAIAFLSNRHGPGRVRPAVFVMNADGTEARKVGSDALPYQGAPDFSPDGSRIVFAGAPIDGGPLQTDLYVVDAHGNDLRRLTNLDAFLSCPRWAPDGERILFSKDIDELLVVEVASGRVTEALPAGVEGSCGDWSPDGSRIAFSSGPDGQLPDLREVVANPSFPQEIFVFDQASGEVTHLPQAGPHSTYPRWSSDGRWIAFQGHVPPGETRHPGFVPVPGRSEVYVMAVDGSQLRRLTHNSHLDGHPTW